MSSKRAKKTLVIDASNGYLATPAECQKALELCKKVFYPEKKTEQIQLDMFKNK